MMHDAALSEVPNEYEEVDDATHYHPHDLVSCEGPCFGLQLLTNSNPLGLSVGRR